MATYNISATYVAGSGVQLSWTYPTISYGGGDPGSRQLKIFLQRSTTKSNWPLQPYFSKRSGDRSEPVPEDGWTTIKTWQLDGDVGNPPTSYTDDFRPNPTANYRLILFFFPNDPGKHTEIDWAPATVSTIPANTPWSKSFGGSLNDFSSTTCTDSSGNVYVAGYFQGTADFTGNGTGVYGVSSLTSRSTTDLFVAKYDASGSLVFVKQFGKVGNNIIQPNAIRLDSGGNIIVGGSFYGVGNFGGSDFSTHGDADCFLAKYSSTGTHTWSVAFGSSFPDVITSIAIDSQDRINVAGFFQGNVTITGTSGSVSIFSYGGGIDPLLAQFNSSGAILWAKNFFNGGTEFARAVLVDHSDNIYLVGYFDGYINFFDSSTSGPHFLNVPGGFLACFNSSGTTQWALARGGSSGSTRFWSAAMDTADNIVVAGDFSGTVDLGAGPVTVTSWGVDQFLVRYNKADGRWDGVQSIIPGYQATLGRVSSVAADDAGNIYVAGNFTGQYSFGTKTVSSSGGVQRGFAAKYNGNYSVVWALAGADTDNQSYSSFVVSKSPSGSIIVSGGFSNTLIFNANTSVSSGGVDALLAKIT